MVDLDFYRDDILRLAAENKSSREITAWLEAKGLTTSHMTVARWIQKQKKERSSPTQAALTPQLTAELPGDLARLNEIYEDVTQKADAVAASWSAESKAGVPIAILTGRPADWIKMTELKLKVIALKLSHLGALQPKEEGPKRSVIILPPTLSREDYEALVWGRGGKK